MPQLGNQSPGKSSDTPLYHLSKQLTLSFFFNIFATDRLQLNALIGTVSTSLITTFGISSSQEKKKKKEFLLSLRKVV